MRRGFTLIELSIAMALSGLVLAVVVSIGLKQQRLYGGVGQRVEGQEQLRHAASILPVDLRFLSPAAGDIAPGQARDTSLELRATIAAAVLCASAAGSIALPAPTVPSDLVSVLASVASGDSLWIFDSDTVGAPWAAFAIRAVSSSSSRCAADAARRFVPPEARASPAIVVDFGDSSLSRFEAGTPVRITRRVRYDLYRGGDSQWYLGFRDWNAVSGKFNQVQPVSGPFLGPSGIRFQYYDAAGREMASGTPDVGGIALIQVSLHATGGELLGQSGVESARRDSTLVSVAIRNRP